MLLYLAIAPSLPAPVGKSAMNLLYVKSGSEVSLAGSIAMTLDLPDSGTYTFAANATLQTANKRLTAFSFMGSIPDGSVTLISLPCITFSNLYLDAAINISGTSFSIDHLKISGSISGCGLANASASFSYNGVGGKWSVAINLVANLPPPFAGPTAILVIGSSSGSSSGSASSIGSGHRRSLHMATHGVTDGMDYPSSNVALHHSSRDLLAAAIYTYKGSFSTTLTVDFSTININASVAITGSTSSGLALQLGGSTTSTVVVPGVPVTFDAFSLNASLAIAPSSTVTVLSLSLNCLGEFPS